MNWVFALPWYAAVIRPGQALLSLCFILLFFSFVTHSQHIPLHTLWHSPSSTLMYILVHFPSGIRIYIPENSSVCAVHLYKWHGAVHIIGNAFFLVSMMFLSYNCVAVVNVFPIAALSYYVCRYQHSVFLSERHLGCLQSLPSKTTLP